MTFKFLGSVPDGGDLRRYNDSGLVFEVGHKGTHPPGWVSEGFLDLEEIKSLQGRVLYFGCGTGILGAHAGLVSEVNRVLMYDKCSQALAVCKHNVHLNILSHPGLFAKCRFVGDVNAVLRSSVDAVLHNMFENPTKEVCGPDGSALQRQQLLEDIPPLLVPGGIVLTKQVSYAANWPKEPAIQDLYDIQKVGEAEGKAPPVLGGVDAWSKYYCLRLKNPLTPQG